MFVLRVGEGGNIFCNLLDFVRLYDSERRIDPGLNPGWSSGAPKKSKK